jgi:hypothetical protein
MYLSYVRVVVSCLLVVVAGSTIAAPAPPVFLPNITDEGVPYTGPTVIALRPPQGVSYTIYGGADVSSVRPPDDSICWAATVAYPDRSIRVRVFRQLNNTVAVEQPLAREIAGRGTLSRDQDGVVLTAVEDKQVFRIYVEGCDE